MFGAIRKNVAIKRPGQGSWQGKKWVDGPIEGLVIQASVQPLKGEDLERLPEARRKLASFSLFTESQLKAAEENQNNPDIAVIDGQEYEVERVEPWQNGLINHYKAIVVRRQPS